MRSASADNAPWAQQEPQYCGMCWLRECVRNEWPETLRQSQEGGRSSSAIYLESKRRINVETTISDVMKDFLNMQLTYSCGRGEWKSSVTVWPSNIYICIAPKHRKRHTGLFECLRMLTLRGKVSHLEFVHSPLEHSCFSCDCGRCERGDRDDKIPRTSECRHGS